MSECKCWIIVWCEEDTSYSLIHETDAIFDKETLAVGDSLTFFYSGKDYVGDVVEIGDDEDYDYLRKRLSDLNTQNKTKKGSFHDDQPRKTRGKGRYTEALEALKPSKRRMTPADSMAKPCSSKQGKKGEECSSRRMAQLDDTDTETDVISTPESSPTPESCPNVDRLQAKQINRKSATKGKAHDISIFKSSSAKDLHHRQDKNNNRQFPHNAKDSVHSSFSSGPRVSDARMKSSKTSGSQQYETDLISPSSSSFQERLSVTQKNIPVFEDSDEEPVNENPCKGQSKRNTGPRGTGKNDLDEGRKEPKKKKDAAVVSQGKEVANTEGTNKLAMLRFTKDDRNVVEIQGRSKLLGEKSIYVENDALQLARTVSNASIFAKHLVVAAFTNEALLTCTVSGGQYRAAGKAKITQKPALNADAVAIIIEAALNRQEKKKWKPELTKRDILTGLRQKLVDLRPRLKQAALVEPEGE